MKKRLRVNEMIRIAQIRVIGADGEQLGVMRPEEALKIAREAGFDLVEIVPTSSPPVCRIMDYSKYKYEQEKKEREARKKQHVIKIKEIRINPRIEEHDYKTKLQHARDFVVKGNKVKWTLIFHGREMAHIERGRHLLDRVIQDTVDIAEVEMAPKKEGRFIFMVITPK
ncbi:MAG: translation initiation factor IF-3 [Candidatus Omnitrophica bacterium]|nr:translation initiation factor IF-3 [Candidatus Omnitrophota bacterium]